MCLALRGTISYLYSIYVFNIFDTVWNLMYFPGFIGPTLSFTRQHFPLYQDRRRAPIDMLFYMAVYFDFP